MTVCLQLYIVVRLSSSCLCLFVCKCICLLVCVYVCIAICMSAWVALCFYVCLSVYMCVCVSVSLSVYLTVCLSSVCLFISFKLHIRLHICLSIYESAWHTLPTIIIVQHRYVLLAFFVDNTDVKMAVAMCVCHWVYKLYVYFQTQIYTGFVIAIDILSPKQTPLQLKILPNPRELIICMNMSIWK